MSKPAFCCGMCFDEIAKKDTVAATLWLDLCEASLDSPILGVLGGEAESMRLLETLGFVTTTENSELILVQVKCLRGENSEDAFFCGGVCGNQG